MQLSFAPSEKLPMHLGPSCPTTRLTLPPSPPTALPTRLLELVDGFTPFGRLGHGNMGTVFLVVCNRSCTPFALKVTRALSSKKQRSHIERDILSSLHHPFLQTLHAHFELGDHSLFLLDFCSGGDLNVLRQKQPEKRFSETAARFYAAEILVALEHMHKLGIVYRDLKPENILLQESGHIKLTDFDLSLRLHVPSKADNYVEKALDMRSTERLKQETLQQRIVTDADPDMRNRTSVSHGGFVNGTNCLAREAFGCSSSGAQKNLTGHLISGLEALSSNPSTEGKSKASKLSRLQWLCLDGKICSRTVKGRLAKEGCCASTGKIGSVKTKKLGNASSSFRKQSARIIVDTTSKNPRDKEQRWMSVVGTDEYVAPEVLKGEEHGFSMDWWSFGIFLYEMIYGHTPFKGVRSEATFANILEKDPDFPGTRTLATQLIAQLLVKDPAARLGSAGGADEIKKHPFFSGVQWEYLPYICRPPFIPRSLSRSDLEERYLTKRWTRSPNGSLHDEDDERLSPPTCRSWLDEVVESVQVTDARTSGHPSSTHYSRSSSSMGFLSRSADGAELELKRDDDAERTFSSIEWSSELEMAAGIRTSSIRR
ncbi:hypothetical protein KP509_04G093600 [Ceratopteris richardii]|uniref:non-specific serine/threonine protein kinase n=1 Tax=Ceratopteris richardii TaxID=49495 RepID=A0A8T2V2W8_CERRI|nr:hypothetical protein KP509_04G093600 [Ceratopteris richardii]